MKKLFTIALLAASCLALRAANPISEAFNYATSITNWTGAVGYGSDFKNTFHFVYGDAVLNLAPITDTNSLAAGVLLGFEGVWNKTHSLTWNTVKGGVTISANNITWLAWTGSTNLSKSKITIAAFEALTQPNQKGAAIGNILGTIIDTTIFSWGGGQKLQWGDGGKYSVGADGGYETRSAQGWANGNCWLANARINRKW